MKTTWLLILVIGVPALVTLFIYFIGRRSILSYREQIIYLEDFILHAPATRENFERILQDFDTLTRNDQDNWRTKIAFGRFKLKYWLFVEEMLLDTAGCERFLVVQKRVKRA